MVAIGKQESFPPKEILRTIYTLPYLKKYFFNKSALIAFFNYTGLFVLILILIIWGLVFLVMKIW